MPSKPLLTACLLITIYFAPGPLPPDHAGEECQGGGEEGHQAGNAEEGADVPEYVIRDRVEKG